MSDALPSLQTLYLHDPTLSPITTACSTVTFAHRPADNLPVALKTILHPHIATRELSLLLSLPPHKNLCPLLDTYATPHRVLVFPRLNPLPPSGLARDLLPTRTLAKDLFTALSHLHANGIIHLDVTPANIMLSETNILTLIDLGLAHRTCDPSPSFARGTAGYIPPEMFLNPPMVSPKADIYAAGIVLAQALTPYLPARLNTTLLGVSVTSCDKIEEIRRALKAFAKDGKAIKAVLLAAEVLANVLHPDPVRRPTADKVLECEFFGIQEEEFREATLQKAKERARIEAYARDWERRRGREECSVESYGYSTWGVEKEAWRGAGRVVVRDR